LLRADFPGTPHQNNNRGGLTLENNVAVSNRNNYSFDVAAGERHLFSNNVSVDGTETINNASSSNNNWNASGPLDK